MRGLAGLEPAGDCAGSNDPPHPDMLIESLDAMVAEIRQFEQPAEQPSRAWGNQDLIGTCQRLQTRGQIWCFAHEREFARRAVADEITNDNEPGRNSDADLELLRDTRRKG